jgi:hypothetical protein
MVVEALLIAIYLHRKTTSIYLCDLSNLKLSRPAEACPAEPSAVSIQLSQLLPCVAEPVTSQQIATEARHTRNRGVDSVYKGARLMVRLDSRKCGMPALSFQMLGFRFADTEACALTADGL